MREFFDILQTVSKRFGVSSDFVHKKIRIDDASVPWQHEQFSKKRIASATISRFAEPTNRSSIFDTANRVNVAALQRNIHIVAEALASYVLDLDGSVSVFQGDESPQESFIRDWLQVLSSSRFHPYASDLSTLKTLQQHFENYLGDVSLQTHSLKTGLTFVGQLSSTIFGSFPHTLPNTLFLTIFSLRCQIMDF